MSDGYTVRDPDCCDGELIPTAWHVYAEEAGLVGDQVYPVWRKFKAGSRWPLGRGRWHKYVDAVIRNRAAKTGMADSK